MQRRVALKLVKLGMDSKAIIQRFQQERQALALMDHESIGIPSSGQSQPRPARAAGLVRGGRGGTHWVSDAVNNNAKRARQRLALPQTPEVKVQLEVPKGVFGPPSRVQPANGMLGGDLERTGTGQIPAIVRGVRDL